MALPGRDVEPCLAGRTLKLPEQALERFDDRAKLSLPEGCPLVEMDGLVDDPNFAVVGGQRRFPRSLQGFDPRLGILIVPAIRCCCGTFQ